MLCCALLAVGPAAGADSDPVESAVTAEQIAAQLERDPVFIQQLAGGGDVEAARSLAKRTISDLPHPVYVVAGRLPVEESGGNSARTFAYALKRLLGDGVFVIAPLRGVATVEPIGPGMPERPRNYEDGARVSEEMLRQFPDDFDKDHGTGEPISRVRQTRLAQALTDLHGLDGGQMTDAEVRRLASLPFLHVVTADPDEQEPPTTGKRWMVGSLVGLLVLVWTPLLLRAVTGSRRRRERLAPSVFSAAARTDAADWKVDDQRLEQRRAQLSGALARIDAHDVRRPELAETALLAKEAADTCAESSSQRDRLGALTLVEHGLHAARSARGDRDYVPWRPCFINPLHGRATQQRQWLLDEAEVQVPLCGACARRVDTSRPTAPLMVREGRRTLPYFEVADIWGSTGYGALIEDYPATVLRAGSERRR